MFKAIAKVRLILDGKTYDAGQKVELDKESVERLQAYVTDIEEVKEEKQEREVKAKKPSTKGKPKKEE